MTLCARRPRLGMRLSAYWPNGISAINISGGWGFLNEGGCGCPVTRTFLYLPHIHLCSKGRERPPSYLIQGEVISAAKEEKGHYLRGAWVQVGYGEG